jgi:S1-C subfamily serine protease
MAGNIGLGFAIPIDLARNIAEQLYTNKGVVRRGTLGVTTQDLTQRLADGLGLDAPRGALITGVYPNSAGAAAGLQTGDVVLQANGQRIDSGAALHNFEGLQGVGSQVTLDVRRAGKSLKLAATLKEQLRQVTGASLDPRLTGATFDELDEGTRQTLRASGANGGVQVGDVKQGSRAWNSGLRPGDIVFAGNTGNFTDLASFRSSFGKAPAQLVLTLWRNGRGEGQLLMR